MSFEDWFKYTYHVIFVAVCFVFFCIIWLIRTSFPVNCWFCNTYSRVHFNSRNSWRCTTCQQYNGFTSDGDYNRPLYQDMQPTQKIMYNYNKFPKRNPSNGLCHKCNINQQLKVMQLANFKPLKPTKFDQEVEQFESHLEEVYKLCKKCNKVVKMKFQQEKGTFLTPKKSSLKIVKKKKSGSKLDKTKVFTMKVVLTLTYILFIVIFYEIYKNANLLFSRKVIRLVEQNWNNLLGLVNYSMDTKLNVTENYKQMYNSTLIMFDHSVNLFHQYAASHETVSFLINKIYLTATKECLMSYITWSVIALHILMFLLECGKSVKIPINTSLWMLSGCLTWSGNKYLLIWQPVILTFIIWITRNILYSCETKMKANNANNSSPKVWKNMKNLSNSANVSQCSDDDLMSEDSDFDDPGMDRNRTSTPEYINHNNLFDRSQVSRPYGFQINNLPNQSFSSYSSNFKPYQHHFAPNCTTELDRGIGTLSLGSKSTFSNGRPSNYFSNFDSSSVVNSTIHRPVISPGKFVYSTQQSWVAGGYWGTESPKKSMISPDTSRSSSQSSGFESMASGNYRKSLFVSPPVSDNHFHKVSTSDNNSVFQNSNSMLMSKFPIHSPNANRERSTRIENFNLSKEYSFVAPTPNNSFIPLDKPRC